MVDEIKILGLTFDRNLGFASHIANTIAKTRVRQNILRRLGGCTCGAETNILRVTHKAIIESVVVYGIVAVGSGAYESELRRLDTCVLNPAARVIAGVGPSARLITLHSTAGTISIHNFFIQGCAQTMDRGLRADRSSIARTIQKWTADQYQITTWEARETSFCPTTTNR